MDAPYVVRPVRPEDASDWERMRGTLWPSSPPGEHAREIAAFFGGDRRDPAEAFLAVADDGRAIGFAEATIRSHAEGCVPGRIAYLEAWYVEPEFRGQGVGAGLVRAVESWGRAQGCAELASDTELENDASAAAHRALGFDEVMAIRCFKKAL